MRRPRESTFAPSASRSRASSVFPEARDVCQTSCVSSSNPAPPASTRQAAARVGADRSRSAARHRHHSSGCPHPASQMNRPLTRELITSKAESAQVRMTKSYQKQIATSAIFAINSTRACDRCRPRRQTLPRLAPSHYQQQHRWHGTRIRASGERNAVADQSLAERHHPTRRRNLPPHRALQRHECGAAPAGRRPSRDDGSGRGSIRPCGTTPCARHVATRPPSAWPRQSDRRPRETCRALYLAPPGGSGGAAARPARAR